MAQAASCVQRAPAVALACRVLAIEGLAGTTCLRSGLLRPDRL